AADGSTGGAAADGSTDGAAGSTRGAAGGSPAVGGAICALAATGAPNITMVTKRQTQSRKPAPACAHPSASQSVMFDWPHYPRRTPSFTKPAGGRNLALQYNIGKCR